MRQVISPVLPSPPPFCLHASKLSMSAQVGKEEEEEEEEEGDLTYSGTSRSEAAVGLCPTCLWWVSPQVMCFFF